MIQQSVFEQSSGNVFVDLVLSNADELFTRDTIMIQALRLLSQRNLKQRDISDFFGISQLELSHFMKREFQRFSKPKLLIFCKRIDMKITLYIRLCHELINLLKL